MTSDLALIALGILAQVATFAIGVLVGRTVSRRTSHDDGNGNTEELATRWRHDWDGSDSAGGRGRVTGGDIQAGEGDPDKRPAC
jgi:hypothetical protein